jgi:hypothetical protein
MLDRLDRKKTFSMKDVVLLALGYFAKAGHLCGNQVPQPTFRRDV